MILNAIGKKKYTLKISIHTDDKKMYCRDVFHFFDTFIKAENSLSFFLLYNQILVFQYLRHSYFVYFHKNEFNNTISPKHTILNIFLGLQKTEKDSYILYLLLIHSRNKDIIILNKYELTAKIDKSMVEFTKIRSTNLALNCKEKYNYNSFYQFSFKHFLLLFKTKIIVFEKFEKFSIMTQNIDISFTNLPYLITNINSELILKSSGNYFYKLNLRNNNNPVITIFNDVTLNFNNEKYVDLLETMKVIIFYNCEVKKLKLSELKHYTKDIFHTHDIYSYIGNLEQILMEENINFFLNHNFENFKFKILILFSLINEKYSFVNKVFALIISNKNYYNIESEEEYHDFQKNIIFQNVIIYIIEIIIDVFENVNALSSRIIIEEFFMNIFIGCESFSEAHKYILFYIEERFNRGKNDKREEKFANLLKLLLDK